MKKKGNSSHRQNVELKFSPNEMVPIASRTYGLMRATNKAVTPYPHVDPGVDAILLKARLSMRRHIDHKRSLDASQSHSVHHNATMVNMRSPSSKSVNMLPSIASNKNMLSSGTPHPTKSIALNAKVLAKRLTAMNEEWIPELPSISERRESRAVRIPAKKMVRLVDNATVNLIHTTHRLDCQRLSDVSLRLTQLDYSVSNSNMCSVDPMSFENRRRLFDQGEYTISKKCKKMSDFIMASTPNHNIIVGDHTLLFAKKAKDEIDRFIKAQGLIKISNDQLKWNRQLDRLSDDTDSSPDYRYSMDMVRSRGNSTIDSGSVGEAETTPLLHHSR